MDLTLSYTPQVLRPLADVALAGLVYTAWRLWTAPGRSAVA
jgi:hypothetical protein